MTIALIIITVAILLGVFFLMVCVGIIYQEQQKMKDELKKAREVEVKVDFPAEMLMEIKDNAELTQEMLYSLLCLNECGSLLDVTILSQKIQKNEFTENEINELYPTYERLCGILRQFYENKNRREESEKSNNK